MNEISIGEKIVRNIFFNILSRFFSIFVNFLLTPYVLYKLGIERFGIWALLIVMVNYFSILDMGLGTSYLKFIPKLRFNLKLFNKETFNEMGLSKKGSRKL